MMPTASIPAVSNFLTLSSHLVSKRGMVQARFLIGADKAAKINGAWVYALCSEEPSVYRYVQN